MSWCYISLFGQQRVHFWRFRRRNEFCRGEPLFGWCRDYKLSSFSFSPHKTVQAFPNTFEYFQVLPSCTPVLFIPCSQDCPVQCPSTSEYFWVLPNTFEYFQVLLSCTPVLFILCSQDCPSTSEYFQILPSCTKYFFHLLLTWLPKHLPARAGELLRVSGRWSLFFLATIISKFSDT